MKRLFRIILIFFFPFYLFAQSTSLKSSISNHLVVSDSIEYFRIKPRILTNTSLNVKNDILNTYILGLKLDVNIMKKIKFVASYDNMGGNFYSEIRNFQDSLGVFYPGFGLDRHKIQFNINYLVNRFISIDAGNGKHSIVNGYQSLLLSDLGYLYPFLKINTEFGPVKYYNLYTTFINPNMVDFGRKKHATIHYLDYSISEKIHIGIFEAILWQSKSEQIYKGYEFAYLNPVIFYRPVEFSKQSSKGNALMGLNFSAKYRKLIFYAQFLLDDLNISRQKDSDDNYQDGFFQNKYGYQLGLKGKISSLKYLFEYNQVQPYTYGHRTILQNYSHMNQALAHPLGANFKEYINLLEFKKEKLTYKLKTMFSVVGLDSLDTHYGQNIFESDILASTGGQYSYGNYNGQGVSTTIFSIEPEISVKFKWFDIYASIYYRTKDSDLLDQNLLFYSLGIRNFIFPIFQDY